MTRNIKPSSRDWSRHLLSVQFRVQSKADRAREAWHSTPSIRLYAVGPEATALQIRGRLDTPAAPPAYAHAVLPSVEDLVALYDAIGVRLKECGLSVRDLKQRRGRMRKAEEDVQGRFDASYVPLARRAVCDPIGSMQHRRIFGEWIDQDCPEDIEGFIAGRANLGAEGLKSDMVLRRRARRRENT